MIRKGLVCSLVVIVCLVLSGVGYYTYASGKDTKKGAAAADKSAQPKKAADKKADNTDKKAKVATVNGVAITRGDLDMEMARFERQISAGGQSLEEAQKKEMQKKILDNLISREVLTQEAQKLSLKAEDAEVDQQIAQLKGRFPSEAEFKSTLDKMNIDEATLKVQFAKDLGIKKLIDQQVAGKATVTPEEMKSFYDGNPDMFKTPEMVRASHILVQVDQKASAEDKAKAHDKIVDIQKKVQAGEDFAALAKQFSDCPSKEKGGDLDFFQKGQMVEPFDKVAFSLEPGKVSDIVETQFGYHIIKVTEKKPAGVTSFDEIKDRIEQHLKQQKMQQELVKYIDDLKGKAKIETFL